MAKSNLLSTSASTYLELIGNGRLHAVPRFQRDYSWTEEQWDDLWTDLDDLAGRADQTHYMGAVVVAGPIERTFTVIDGQQRLATLSLLILAVIERLQTLAQEDIDSAANGDRARELRSKYIGTKVTAALIEVSRLTLNDSNDAFFQDYLVQLRQPRVVRALPRSNRLLWDCFVYFRSKVREWKEGQASGEDLWRLVDEVVGERLLFIRIVVDDDLGAYTVFETLNARGLELSATDLLKNYLFSRLKVVEDLHSLQRRWNDLVATVRQERFPDFLRYHLLCEVPRVRSRRLFKLIRDRIKTPDDTFRLIDALEQRAELFAALSDPHHPYWVQWPNSVSSVAILKLLGAKQMTPLVFAAAERFEPADFARVMKLLVALMFRHNTVAGANTSRLESLFHEAAKGILDGRLRTPAAVFETLRSIYVDDAGFEREFQQFTTDAASGRNDRLVRYILTVLESDAAGLDIDTASASVEHVLPANPSEAWETSFPRETWERYVDRIGNLTWLEPSLNRRVGNATIAEKREAYESSRYALTASLAQRSSSGWTPDELEARQASMAKRAVHLWRADFA